MSALVDLWSNDCSKHQGSSKTIMSRGSDFKTAKPAEEQVARKLPDLASSAKSVAKLLHKSISETTLCMLLDVFSP